jgi:hypothetical protein
MVAMFGDSSSFFKNTRELSSKNKELGKVGVVSIIILKRSANIM